MNENCNSDIITRLFLALKTILLSNQQFVNFISRHGDQEWVIASDEHLNIKNNDCPNRTIAYALIPFKKFEHVKDHIKKYFPTDLKNYCSRKNTLIYLNNLNVFIFIMVLDRENNLFKTSKSVTTWLQNLLRLTLRNCMFFEKSPEKRHLSPEKLTNENLGENNF